MNSIEYGKAVAALQIGSRRILGRWGTEFDVLLTPTMAIEPPPVGQASSEAWDNPDGIAPTVLAMAVFTATFNIIGLPAVSLPLHQAESGLPIGVQLAE